MINPLDLPIYGLGQPEKEAVLLAGLSELTATHRAMCPGYARILDAFHTPTTFTALDQVPFLPVSLFKTHRLLSVAEDQVFKTLTSSGTTGQAVSRIFLDRDTANLQAHALARIMSALLGPARLPMVIVDAPSTVRDRAVFGARAAGVRGMMTFGRAHFFALDDQMQLDADGLRAFLAAHAGSRILLFGFTFMVWKHFLPAVEAAGLRFDDAVLVHSGGWKKLADEAVDNHTFKQRLTEATGIATIRNFYGMAEQVGSVFMEGEDGHLHPPAFADIIVRDPLTLRVLPAGEVGVAQVVSLLPHSYPGHSLLTEDLAVVHACDAPGNAMRGKAFSILGRVPRAELRGCSDTYAAGRGA
ncbi:MAG: acyl-protein synthetase [Bacteroidota bacterium]